MLCYSWPTCWVRTSINVTPHRYTTRNARISCWCCLGMCGIDFFLISVFLVRFLEKKLGFSPEWVWFGSMWKKRSRPPYGSDITHCLKNEPNLATCIFVEHRLVLTIFGKQRQHTFRNYTHIQLSLSLHVCLLYLFFGLCGVRLSVCPSVCLSRSWILLKWIILWLIFFTVG